MRRSRVAIQTFIIMTTTLFREFTIEAGRYLPYLTPDHPCGRMHGHTFVVQIHITGEVDEEKGWIMDFNDLDDKLNEVRHMLDHKVLNEIPGLENPTTELLARWLWERLIKDLPGLSRIVIQENPHTGCIYTGD